MEWDGRALRTSSGMGAADCGEYRQAAGPIEPPSDVGNAMI